MYDVQITVNGSRCKQYNHNGQLFVEAKHGSEYAVEIKNNSWERILAVVSVDGLNILTGKTATSDGPGYVISAYGSDKLTGFRVSNEKVAKFVFGNKGNSYASSKEDGSEKNVGVIGVLIFKEKVKPTPPPVEIHHHHWPKPTPPPWIPHYPYDDPYYKGTGTIWTDQTYTTSCGAGASLGDDEMKGGGDLNCFEPLARGLCDSGATKGISAKMSKKLGLCASNFAPKPTRGFDMGTEWGEAKDSKVIEVQFEKGILDFTANIYYASRQSLIEMGVPIGNEKQVSFPEPFADTGYAKPPKGWRG